MIDKIKARKTTFFIESSICFVLSRTFPIKNQDYTIIIYHAPNWGA
jgi:hypothetical protein